MHLGDILDIMSEKAGGITLHEAMHIARNIMELHSADLRTARGESYEEGYAEGVEEGRRSVTPTPFELENHKRAYERALELAKVRVVSVVEEVGKEKKVQAIKALRNDFAIGLKDARDIVDAHVKSLDFPALADWELDLLSDKASYSDEPPF